LVSLVGHTGPVYDLRFAPDGLTLASASADTTVLVWRTPPPAP
jgi:WD40 repeat protein